MSDLVKLSDLWAGGDPPRLYLSIYLFVAAGMWMSAETLEEMTMCCLVS